MVDVKFVARRVRGKPWSKLGDVPLTPSTLRRLGYALVKALKEESAKDFAKRGWTGQDPNGGKPVWDSFSFRVVGSEVVLMSTFYGLKEMVSGDIPGRKMTWLTQEAKDAHPEKYPLSPREKELGMKIGGRISKGQRLPLVVPLESEGVILFRVAPLTFGEAWVHPGVAKFTFLERGIRKGKAECLKIIQKEIVKTLEQGDPFR